jgi:hypothetical protein
MPSSHPDTPESAIIRNWIESTVVANYDYDASHIGETMTLYSCRAGCGYLNALLDGLAVTQPTWVGPNQAASTVFYKALGSYLAEFPSHLAQLLDHDGAYWEVRRVMRITSDARYLPWVLSLLHREPADEAGATVIMLIADDQQSAIVLADCPYPLPPYPEGFCIAFHGTEDRRNLLLQRLEQAASSTDAILL